MEKFVLRTITLTPLPGRSDSRKIGATFAVTISRQSDITFLPFLSRKTLEKLLPSATPFAIIRVTQPAKIDNNNKSRTRTYKSHAPITLSKLAVLLTWKKFQVCRAAPRKCFCYREHGRERESAVRAAALKVMCCSASVKKQK
jgi:hypothetical protein